MPPFSWVQIDQLIHWRVLKRFSQLSLHVNSYEHAKNLMQHNCHSTESITLVCVCVNERVCWEETIYWHLWLIAGHVKSMTNQYGEHKDSQTGADWLKNWLTLWEKLRYASMSFTSFKRAFRIWSVYLHLYWILTCMCVSVCVCVTVCIVVMCTRSHKCQTMWVTIINVERTANTSNNIYTQYAQKHEGEAENKPKSTIIQLYIVIFIWTI